MKNQDLSANLKMQIKKGKLAIIAGGGDLVLSSIKSCKTQNINYFLIGIKDFYKDLTFSPDAYLSLNNIGNIFSILYKEKIKFTSPCSVRSGLFGAIILLRFQDD